MKFTKIDQADLDSPRREFSNDGLGNVVALLVFLGELFFCRRLLEVQSSCTQQQKRCKVRGRRRGGGALPYNTTNDTSQAPRKRKGKRNIRVIDGLSGL